MFVVRSTHLVLGILPLLKIPCHVASLPVLRTFPYYCYQIDCHTSFFALIKSAENPFSMLFYVRSIFLGKQFSSIIHVSVRHINVSSTFGTDYAINCLSVCLCARTCKSLSGWQCVYSFGFGIKFHARHYFNIIALFICYFQFALKRRNSGRSSSSSTQFANISFHFI